ncbi:MAG: response regulator [Synergistaceae bacterium]|jgi:signal transduction histidine kinase/CheY-like chemotaxis protein|nr:response regulator [Synergistaceae bacterium]
MSIRIKVIAIIIAIVVVITASSIAIGLYFADNNLVATIENDMTVVVEIAEELVSANLDLFRSTARAVADRLSAAGPGDIEAVLREQVRRNGYLSIAILGVDDAVTSHGDALPDEGYIGTSYAKRALFGETVVSSTEKDRSGRLVVRICAPMSESRIMVATLPGTVFRDIISKFKIWNTGNIFMLDWDGVMIANTRLWLVEERRNFADEARYDPSVESVGKFYGTMIRGGSGVGNYIFENSERICAYMPVSRSYDGWSIGAVAPIAESPIATVGRILMIAGGVVLALGVAAALLAAKKISGPMEKINEQNIRLVDLMQMVESASQAKSQLLASISHEVRAPLNAIVETSDLTRDRNLDEPTKRYISDMKQMSRSLLKIITNVLDFSIMEAGKMDLSPVDFDIVEMYGDICRQAQFMMNGTMLQFRRRLGEEVPPVIYADEVRVRQIITNLVNNAIQFTREGCVDLLIDRETVNGRECLLIKVEDTGIGIKEEDFSKLFDPFQRLDVKKHGNKPGTGLGLSITKRFVDMMGGRITLESKYGEGSTFTVWLPLVVGDYSKAVMKDDSLRIFVSEGTNVLIADDDPAELESAIALLAKSNIKADVAESGMEAVDKIRGKRYDLVMIKKEMREMDGIAAVRCIRAFSGAYFRKAPIIAMIDRERDREALLNSGFSDSIIQPLETPMLNRMLLKWLPSSKMLDWTEASRITQSA